MTINSKAIKAQARERMGSALPKPFHEGLLYVLSAGALAVLSVIILSSKITTSAADEYMRLVMSQRYEDAINYIGKLMPETRDSLISFVLQLFSGIVAAGLSIFCMNTLRGKETSLWNLLDGFGRFFPLLLLLFLMRAFTMLWSYLFIIPGIIAFYRYRLAVYLMIDHPNLGAFTCIIFSGRLMRGRKIDLLLLDLSFLGWWILAALPFLIGSSFAGLLPMILGAIGSGLILAWLYPYYELSCVGFYETIKTPIEIQPPDEEL